MTSFLIDVKTVYHIESRETDATFEKGMNVNPIKDCDSVLIAVEATEEYLVYVTFWYSLYKVCVYDIKAENTLGPFTENLNRAPAIEMCKCVARGIKFGSK